MRRPFWGYYPVTQTFGVNPALYQRFGLKGHNGVDYGMPNYTRVIAPHSGVVVEAGWSYGGYGYYVKIQNGVEGSVLAHLSRIDVRPGQWVNERQAVALSDNTGNSSGPHLHWGYYRLPRNRANGYDGFIFQGPYITDYSRGGGKDEGEVTMPGLHDEDYDETLSEDITEEELATHEKLSEEEEDTSKAKSFLVEEDSDLDELPPDPDDLPDDVPAPPKDDDEEYLNGPRN